MKPKDGALIAGIFLLVTAADQLEDNARSEFIAEMQRVLGNARRKVTDGRATAQLIVGTALLAHVVYTSIRDSRADATVLRSSPPGSAGAGLRAPTPPLGPRPGGWAWVRPTGTDRRRLGEGSGPPASRERRTPGPLPVGRCVRT